MSLYRKLGQLLLAVAALVTVVRVAQLAVVAHQDLPAVAKMPGELPETSAAPGSAGGSAGSQSAVETSIQSSTPGRAGGCGTTPTDAELAELYAACPLAAVIDWQTVARSPEQAEALLPPYRETADHVPEVVDESNIPRIRYPVQVEVPHTEGVRVAQLPQAKNSWSYGPLLVAATPASPAESPSQSAPPANVKLGEWLIDPGEWLTPADKPAAAAPAPPAATLTPSPATVVPPTAPKPVEPEPVVASPPAQPPAPGPVAGPPVAKPPMPQPAAPQLPAPEPIASEPPLATPPQTESKPVMPETVVPPQAQPPAVAGGLGQEATPSPEPPQLPTPTPPLPEPSPATVPDASEIDLPKPEPVTLRPPAPELRPVQPTAPAPPPKATAPPANRPEVAAPPASPKPAPPATEAVPPAATQIFAPPSKPEALVPADAQAKEALPRPQPPAAAGGYVPPTQVLPPPPPPEAPTQVPSLPAPNDGQPAANDVPPTSSIQQPTTPLLQPPPSPELHTPSSQPPASTIFSAPPAKEPQADACTEPAKPTGPPPAVDPHLELYTKNAYPSARECAVCHEEIYHQWSVSAHAYAAVSPMFNKFEQRLNDLSQGTVGYFCMRCHSPVGVSLCLPRDLPLWKQPESAREGITCVACHRVQFAYGKSNGERRIEQGDIYAPVFGGIGGDGVAAAIERKSDLKLKTSADDKGPGQNMHIAGVYFQPLTRSEFCTPCHQVAVHPGIKLEVVWEQYRASPACKKGIQCQDCHMGRVPGMPLGYECGPIAKVSGKTVNDNRKKSNHMFHGPNYSIAHPGVFPFHLKSNRWTIDEWLTFDWRAGWGTKEFEDAVEDGKIKCEFPPVWAEVDDRMDAREIIDDNFKKLQLKRENRIQVMENGSRVEGPFFDSTLCRGQDLDLHYIVSNTNDGHNLLTASLGAQPQLWANVVLIGPDGRRLWETGYVDSVGDVANIHSQDVRKGRLAFDWQLFNLQTMFLTTGVKGTDREFFVPVNFDIDQIPFIRPGAQPITTINHPPFIRMESQSLAATGSRRVPYRIPGELLQQPGRYRLSFRMRSRSEPIYFMQFCFATEEMQRSMNENMIDIHAMSVEFDVR